MQDNRHSHKLKRETLAQKLRDQYSYTFEFSMELVNQYIAIMKDSLLNLKPVEIGKSRIIYTRHINPMPVRRQTSTGIMTEMTKKCKRLQICKRDSLKRIDPRLLKENDMAEKLARRLKKDAEELNWAVGTIGDAMNESLDSEQGIWFCDFFTAYFIEKENKGIILRVATHPPVMKNLDRRYSKEA